jgi:hypothetical protein
MAAKLTSSVCGELMIEARHRDTVLGNAAVHRTVGYSDCRHHAGARRSVGWRKSTQKCRQFLPHRGCRFGRSDRGCNDSLVHCGARRKISRARRREPLRNAIRSRLATAARQ